MRRRPTLSVRWVDMQAACIWCLTAGIAFFNLTSLDQHKYEVGIDLTVIIKLGMTLLAGVFGGLGLLLRRDVREFFLAYPGLVYTALLGFFVAASVTSITPVSSLGSTFALICISTFSVYGVKRIGAETMLGAIFFGIGVYVIGSWIAYLYIPEIGLHHEDLGEGINIERMAGLSHPNTTGQYCGLFLGFTYITYRRWRWSSNTVLLLAVAGVALLALAGMVEAISRSSVLALVAAFTFAHRDQLLRFTGPVLPLVAATLLSVVVFIGAVLPHGVFSLGERASVLTKTGDIEELQSMTGRTQIWAFAVEQLAKRPFLGYGPATSKIILVDYMYYTHNLWLNVAFSCGIFAAILLIFFTGILLGNMLRHREPLSEFFISFLLVVGLVENVAFAYIPSVPTQLFMIGLAWQIEAIRAKTSAVTLVRCRHRELRPQMI
jgi:exopolysaccharide production protein ExoQ